MSRVAERLEDIMLSSQVYTRHAFAKRIGYSTVGTETALYRALAGRQIRYKKLCDIAERLGMIPVLFFRNKTGKPIFCGREDAFKLPLDYEYLKSKYVRDVLRLRREESPWDFSLSELGERAGFWKQTVFEIESGDYAPSVPHNLEKICQPLGVTPEYFVNPLDTRPAPPEQKTVSESLARLMTTHKQISTINRLSKFIGLLPDLVRYQIEQNKVSSRLLVKICRDLRVERHSLKKSRMLPFVIWYRNDRTNSWRVETLGTNMLLSGKLPSYYTIRSVSQHRSQAGQRFQQHGSQSGFLVSRMENTLHSMGLVPQYFVKTLQVN